MTADLDLSPEAGQRLLSLPRLYLDDDGDLCCARNGHNLVACPAVGDRPTDGLLNPDMWVAIPRFQALARALAAENARLRAERDAAWQAGAEAMLRKLSGNTGELRDAVAAAIRADGSDLCDGPWGTLPEANRLGWRGDAERAIAAVKDYLTAQALPLPGQPPNNEETT